MNPIIPKTNSAPGAGAPASLYLGELASNRTTGKLYLGCDAGVVEIQGGGGGTAGSQISPFTGTGSQTVFAPLTGYSNTTAGNYLVSVSGIDQRPTTDWTISSANGGTITFASAPPNGASIVVRAFVGASGGGGGGEPERGGIEWDVATAYSVGDIVSTDQESPAYFCTVANTAQTPMGLYPNYEAWRPIRACAVSLLDRPLDTTAPTDGQAVVWDESGNTWKPGTVITNNTSAQRAFAIGDSSTAQDTGFAVGPYATAGAYGMAIGAETVAGPYELIIGSAAAANSYTLVKIGQYSLGALSNDIWNLQSSTSEIPAIKSKVNEIIGWINNNGGNISPL